MHGNRNDPEHECIMDTLVEMQWSVVRHIRIDKYIVRAGYT